LNSGSFAATDQGYAENFTAPDGLIAGTIVAIDATGAKEVKAAAAGDELVGVVSASAGFTAGSSAQTTSVVISGHAQVRVNNTNGDIAVGDPIAIGAMAGIGTKQTASGDSIGFALQPFIGEGGGLIAVYLRPGYREISSSNNVPSASTILSAPSTTPPTDNPSPVVNTDSNTNTNAPDNANAPIDANVPASTDTNAPINVNANAPADANTPAPAAATEDTTSKPTTPTDTNTPTASTDTTTGQ
jgi:hypothetical protein